MNEFKTYHPIVNFLYFLFVIGFSMFFMHPLCLAVSWACALSYSVMLRGKSALRGNLLYMLPLMAITALINPAFNHEGSTILAYLPSGNPLTLESVLYGLCAAAMLVSVLCWFSCYNEILTSDKLLWLFGRIAPALSLLFSMTLRFIPEFAARFRETAHAQKCLGCDAASGNVIKRAKSALKLLSAVTTRSLENAIETADSMKARGYGLPGRTAFSVFILDKRDKRALAVILFLGGYVLAGAIGGSTHFRFFPKVQGAAPSLFNLSVFTAYLFLCMLPIIIEIREVKKWKALSSKI